MFDKIVNPKINYMVSVNSILGKNILQNYIYHMNGGMLPLHEDILPGGKNMKLKNDHVYL